MHAAFRATHAETHRINNPVRISLSARARRALDGWEHSSSAKLEDTLGCSRMDAPSCASLLLPPSVCAPASSWGPPAPLPPHSDGAAVLRDPLRRQELTRLRGGCKQAEREQSKHAPHHRRALSDGAPVGTDGSHTPRSLVSWLGWRKAAPLDVVVEHQRRMLTPRRLAVAAAMEVHGPAAPVLLMAKPLCKKAAFAAHPAAAAGAGAASAAADAAAYPSAVASPPVAAEAPAWGPA